MNLLAEKGHHKELPDAQLAASPLNSPEGKQYFSAMAVAANFAFNNRQHILHEVRQAFKEVFAIHPEEVPLLYDVCHNIARFETHFGKTVCVHRKGVT